ncbi:hypothetical protein H5410_011208 [Solanum commersonii]|uniref:Uncharacterized protein n=1 Tax=Solanum commersonii TaxID=4109 RepID=A0A9J6AN03_SOLCO|nr:hypothetical protein H5410_011208 [Solanum commersonii]
MGFYIFVLSASSSSSPYSHRLCGDVLFCAPQLWLLSPSILGDQHFLSDVVVDDDIIFQREIC